MVERRVCCGPRKGLSSGLSRASDTRVRLRVSTSIFVSNESVALRTACDARSIVLRVH